MNDQQKISELEQKVDNLSRQQNISSMPNLSSPSEPIERLDGDGSEDGFFESSLLKGLVMYVFFLLIFGTIMWLYKTSPGPILTVLLITLSLSLGGYFLYKSLLFLTDVASPLTAGIYALGITISTGIMLQCTVAFFYGSKNMHIAGIIIGWVVFIIISLSLLNKMLGSPTGRTVFKIILGIPLSVYFIVSLAFLLSFQLVAGGYALTWQPLLDMNVILKDIVRSLS